MALGDALLRGNKQNPKDPGKPPGQSNLLKACSI